VIDAPAGRTLPATLAAMGGAAPLAPGSAARMRDRGLSLVALVALWWVVAFLTASPQLLPAPERVFAVFLRLLRDGELPFNIAVTLARVAIAFVIAMIAGTVLGVLAGRSPRFDAVIDPWLTVGLNLPVLVVIVLAYIWIGLNDVAAVVAVAIAKTPTVVVTIREGGRAFDRQLDEMASVYRLGLWRRLRWIALPQLAPYLAAAGRSGLSITWKIVLIVELLGRPNGVGFALNMQFQNFNVAAILAYGLSFAAIMLVMEAAVLQPWERRANAWRKHA
jgi:NitT/TauT family transport system permease protein